MGDMVIPQDLRRNLSQYQDVDLCDIELEPFAIECKRYAKGSWYQKDWIEQVNRAAARINMIPVLIWKYDRLPIAMLPVTFTTLEDACSVMREWLV